jgi:hypothetical protein
MRPKDRNWSRAKKFSVRPSIMCGRYKEIGHLGSNFFRTALEKNLLAIDQITRPARKDYV